LAVVERLRHANVETGDCGCSAVVNLRADRWHIVGVVRVYTGVRVWDR
jgi:hypothetical protein